MLKYIWTVIQDLFVTVSFATLIHTFLRTRYGKKGTSVHWTGICLGVLASVALAIVKNTTNKIVSSHWNHYIYVVILLFTLAFVILSLIFGKRKDALWHAGGFFLSFAGAGLTAVWIFYTLPGVLAYPFVFNTMGNGYLSWYYFQRLIGWAVALILLAVYARLLAECAFQMRNQQLPLAALLIGLLANAFYCVGRYFVPWVNRAKWLKWPVAYDKDTYGWAGELMKFTSRTQMYYIWIVAALSLLLLAALFFENTKVKDHYDNPAQLRKLRARNRRHRRLAGGLLVFLAASVLSMSVIKAYDTRVIELSAPEVYTVEDDVIVIPAESVNDGHLHRFEYKTENDIDVRWIVVKKPGSATYGVGLDACEVCGNAGYFERNGQVICKRCDVVMNINTIGFKGGCNPIPLTYEVRDGNLIFQISDLVAGEKEFR